MRGLIAVLMVWLASVGLGLAQAVPERLIKQLRNDPAPYLDLAADLIHGFGGAKGIDRAGIAQFTALERAKARAGALRSLCVIDLDFDDNLTKEEIARVAAAASAGARGRLWKTFETADGDGDGAVSASEIAGFGRAAALSGFDFADEAQVMSVLAFDGNADGWVDLAEVKSALTALGI